MTDLPYTDDDLRAEAARQHAALTEDPEFMCIGERMQWTPIPSRPDDHWDDLDRADFDTAQRAIDGLLASAADVSEWAVSLGADGLEPDGHTLQLAVGDRTDSADEPTVRMHFAFHPDMEAADRDHFVVELSKAVLRNL